MHTCVHDMPMYTLTRVCIYIHMHTYTYIKSSLCSLKFGQLFSVVATAMYKGMSTGPLAGYVIPKDSEE